MSTLGGSTVAAFAVELVPATANPTPVRSRAHNGPILSYVGPQAPPVNPLGTHGPPGTPPPRGNQVFRPYVRGFSMPVNGHEEPYGMSTAIMKILHNLMSTYADPLTNVSSPLEGSGSGVNNLG